MSKKASKLKIVRHYRMRPLGYTETDITRVIQIVGVKQEGGQAVCHGDLKERQGKGRGSRGAIQCMEMKLC